MADIERQGSGLNTSNRHAPIDQERACAFRFEREMSMSLTSNIMCENLAVMAHDKSRSRRQFIRDSGIAAGLVVRARGARADQAAG
jgi:hypothetical protein